MKRLVPCLILVSACGGKPAPATAPVDNGGGDPPTAPPYMALFQDGKSWNFTTEQLDAYWDDTDPNADANGMVRNTSQGRSTCVVDGVVEYEGGTASVIRCDGDLGENSMGREPISGLWVADQTGLHHTYGEDLPTRDAPPNVEDMVLILERAPKAKQEVGHDDEEDPERETSWTTIRQDGDAWCWESSFAWGDESWDTLCIGPDGFESGSFGWAGGSEHEITFTLE
jgi:hypothetical protein